MTIQLSARTNEKPLIVGSLSGATSMKGDTVALRGRCDIVELRWDLIFAEGERWSEAMDLWGSSENPVLMTARVPQEGGKCAIPLDVLQQMAAMVREGDYWDVELSSWLNDRDRRDVLLRGWKGIAPKLVMSFHDFTATPSLSHLRHLRDQAREAKAQIFKVAAYLRSEVDLKVLLELQQEEAGIAVATMGMGDLGAESRVRCAIAGSVLNYGYLGSEPTAPGQWEAGKLREVIYEQLALH